MKESRGPINSAVIKFSLWAIQLIIFMSVLNFLKFGFLSDMANRGPTVISYAISILALITTFLVLYQYQKLVKEFSLQKESADKEVRAEE